MSMYLKKIAAWLVVCGISFAARADILISVNAGDTLSDMTLFTVEPGEAYGYATAIPGTLSGGVTGNQLDLGPLPTTFYGQAYVVLLGVFTDGLGHTDVGASMPSALASSYSSSSSWTDFDTSANFDEGLLPTSEATLLSDMQSAGNANGFVNTFYYMQASDPILLSSGGNGTIVGFDGAEDIGSLIVSVPEPSVAGLFALGVASLALAGRKALLVLNR